MSLYCCFPVRETTKNKNSPQAALKTQSQSKPHSKYPSNSALSTKTNFRNRSCNGKPCHQDIGFWRIQRLNVWSQTQNSQTHRNSVLICPQEAKLSEIANTWESAVWLTHAVSGYQSHLGLLKIRRVFKILPLTASHTLHAISQFVPESCQDTNKSEDKGVTVPLCEGLAPLPSGRASTGKKGESWRTHMAFPPLQLFNCLDPHPLEYLSSLHGSAESGLATAYLPGCSPISTTPRGYVRRVQ